MQFSISYPLSEEKLLASIGKVGIIEPVLLLWGQRRLRIVSGFKRLEAARELGLKEVPAVVNETWSEQEALLRAIHSNAGRALNTVERANALEKMALQGFSSSEMDEAMALMSMPSGPHVLALHRLIADAEKLVKDFIVARNLSLKSIEYLFRFEPGERKLIITTFASMHITESQIRETLEMLLLLKIKVGGLESGFLKNATDPQALRVELKQKIHPGLTFLEENLAKIKKAAALPPGIDIRVDPFFEKEYIDIVIRTKENAEAQNLIDKTGDVIRQGHIRSILELTKGRVR